METAVFPLMGFSRLRIGMDGVGVTTLAAAHGCPLRCRYCLNAQCWDPQASVRRVTPEELREMARLDDLYFRATGGGVTFGGGEPLVYAEFIRAFRGLCGDGWNLTAETCLNVPAEKVRIAAGCVNDFLVDIKDMNPVIYLRYTGLEYSRVLANLRELLDSAGPEHVTVRVPLIPDFNTPEDTERSAEQLRAMGVEKLDRFTYRKRQTDRDMP